jgi:hypothetical protein
MIIAKKQLKLTPKKMSSLFTLFTIILTMVVLISISLFLYKNFYQAITQTKEILVLREKVALDTVDIKKFDSIIDKLSKKTSVKELLNIASPFR